MAPFHALVLLRVAPLASATSTLVFGNVQHFFLSTLNLPVNKAPSRALPPTYWAGFFRRGVKTAVALLLATITTCVANCCVDSPALRDSGAYGLYVAGAVLGVAHFAFAPVILGSGMALGREEGGKGEGGAGVDVFAVLDRWLWAQRLQMWTVDLGAWLVLVVAVGRALEV